MGGDDIGYPPDYYVSAGELKIEFCGGEQHGEAVSTSPASPCAPDKELSLTNFPYNLNRTPV